MSSLPLIKFKEEKTKPTWEVYQVSWADVNHNELLPILTWDKNDNGKEKQREEPTWEATIDAWTNNNQSEMPPILDWEEKSKKIGKGKEENIPEKTTTWDNESCLTCSEQLLNEGMWNDISGREGMCDTSCQYMILISNWVSRGTPITAVWHQAISCLDGYPHDKDEIWRMANAKVEDALPSEILKIKNNPPEPTDIVLVLNLDIFIDLENSPEEFHEHYQNLAPTRKEQEQCLEEINTQLCDHCLIPCNFQFCDDCDLIYNPPLHIIYMISKEKEPINSYTSESESSSNSDSNSDNDDNKNNGSSSV
ncbi:hypothetical protein G9A89_020038 [Geosiphon pyriformis]|nr:hypothetical protein G9A89_020038 [Geosiphon pyriformis]